MERRIDERSAELDGRLRSQGVRQLIDERVSSAMKEGD